MKRLLFGGALLMLATGASALETPDDYIGPLSVQEYETYLTFEEGTLNCEEHTSNTGYIPVTWAYVTLQLPEHDRQQVLIHHEATMYESQGNGSPATLCAEVQQFLASVANEPYVRVAKKSEVEVSLVPRYGGGCERELIERVTLTLNNRLVLQSTNMRLLSGGTPIGTDCFELPPIFR